MSFFTALQKTNNNINTFYAIAWVFNYIHDILHYIDGTLEHDGGFTNLAAVTTLLIYQLVSVIQSPE